MSKIDDCGRAMKKEFYEKELTSVGISDFIGFVWIKPNFLITTSQDG